MSWGRRFSNAGIGVPALFCLALSLLLPIALQYLD